MNTKPTKSTFARFALALLLAVLPLSVLTLQAKTPHLYPSGYPPGQEPEKSAQAGQELQTATIVAVKAHPEGRPFDWLNEGSTVPIYDGYPFYDMTVQLGDKQYVVRYESVGGYYPSAWKPGSEVKVRVDHGQMFILRYDGVLVPAGIM